MEMVSRGIAVVTECLLLVLAARYENDRYRSLPQTIRVPRPICDESQSFSLPIELRVRTNSIVNFGEIFFLFMRR